VEPSASRAAPVEAIAASIQPRVSYLVYRVERRLRARLDRAVGAEGITTTEYVTLSVLRNRDGLSSAQLARWAFVTPQAMNLVISGLERRELVSRRPSASNRRVLEASVTRVGLAILDRCEASMDGIEADMLGDLSPPEVEALRAALAACAQSLESAPRRDAGDATGEPSAGLAPAAAEE
jgi:DNA-binding MarR family transcriptional regulator